jgi:hypothetical protein
MVEIFAAEARAFFDTGASEVVEGQLDDGTRYLLLRAPVPGSGRTRHLHTQRLSEPQPGAVELHRARPSWMAVILLVGLALGAGLVTAGALSQRAHLPPPVTPSFPSLPVKVSVVPVASPTPSVVAPPGLAPDVAAEPARPAPEPPARPVKRVVVLQEGCDPDETWKKNRLRDLDDLAALAGGRNAIPAIEMESIERNLAASIRSAVSSSDCVNIQRAVEGARRRIVGE